jgi:hypothetical protein
VGVEKAFLDAVRIVIGIHVAVVSTVTATPEYNAALSCTGTYDG